MRGWQRVWITTTPPSPELNRGHSSASSLRGPIRIVLVEHSYTHVCCHEIHTPCWVLFLSFAFFLFVFIPHTETAIHRDRRKMALQFSTPLTTPQLLSTSASPPQRCGVLKVFVVSSTEIMRLCIFGQRGKEHLTWLPS